MILSSVELGTHAVGAKRHWRRVLLAAMVLVILLGVAIGVMAWWLN